MEPPTDHGSFQSSGVSKIRLSVDVLQGYHERRIPIEMVQHGDILKVFLVCIVEQKYCTICVWCTPICTSLIPSLSSLVCVINVTWLPVLIAEPSLAFTNRSSPAS